MAINLAVAQFIQTEAHSDNRTAYSPPATMTGTIAWLQGITLVWMLVECGVSLYGAVTAHSSALLAFGADSFVELLSATVDSAPSGFRVRGNVESNECLFSKLNRPLPPPQRSQGRPERSAIFPICISAADNRPTRSSTWVESSD